MKTLFRAMLCGWLISGGLSCLLLPVRADEPIITANLLRMESSQVARRALSTPSRFLWDQQPLRLGLISLADAHRLGIWLDRRVDPSQPVSYSPANSANASICWPENSLGARLEQVAHSMSSDAGLVGNVLYVGPAGETAKLQCAAVNLHDVIHGHDSALAAELHPLQWSELTTPQQLLEQIAERWRIEIDGELPHDLLHAGSLHAQSSLATQLTIVCGGFGQSAELVGKRRFALRPLAEVVAWSSVYPKKELDQTKLARARAAFPQGKMLCRGDSCSVAGATDFHLALYVGVPDKPTQRRGPNASRTVWSFEIADTPVEALMDQLATGVGLEIVWDPSCTAEHRSRLLELKVEQATLDELLTQVTVAAGLEFTRRGQTITLRASPKKPSAN